jgi:hypothetical protein
VAIDLSRYLVVPVPRSTDNMPKWFIKAVDKLDRRYVWKDHEQANGCSFIIEWDQVQMPLYLGGWVTSILNT